MTIEFEILLTLAGMIGFYNAGEIEARDGGKHHGMLWAGLSVLISGVVFVGLGGDWLSWLGAQAGLFVGIGAVRVWLEDRAKK